LFSWPFYNVFANAACARERQEHRIFKALLLLVPGLEERLMQSSNEGVIYIAELVCVYVINAAHTLTVRRFRKALRAHDLMTPRA